MQGANSGLAVRRDLLEALKELSRDTKDYGGSQVRRLKYPFAPADFYRDFVATNTPCVIQGATSHWPALTKWSSSYLIEACRETRVPVAVTPNGLADAVTQLPGGSPVFALPAEGTMAMSELLNHLKSEARGPTAESNVAYSQHQNDCLRERFPPLLADVDAAPRWAAEVFGAAPEAVNLWIGGPASSTTFHKDHYENLFAPILGSKTFTVLPPTDVYRLSIAEYPVARYEALEAGADCDLRSCRLELRLEEPAAKVPWCPVHPNDASEAEHPLFFDPSLPPPLKITVRAGEMLYLPSLWHHFVEQTPGPEEFCAAVNLWYDMAMDARYAHFCFVEKLASLATKTAK